MRTADRRSMRTRLALRDALAAEFHVVVNSHNDSCLFVCFTSI